MWPRPGSPGRPWRSWSAGTPPSSAPSFPACVAQARPNSDGSGSPRSATVTATDGISVERDGHVATVWLDRPERGNGFVSAMQIELHRQLEAAGRRPRGPRHRGHRPRAVLLHRCGPGARRRELRLRRGADRPGAEDDGRPAASVEDADADHRGDERVGRRPRPHLPAAVGHPDRQRVGEVRLRVHPARTHPRAELPLAAAQAGRPVRRPRAAADRAAVQRRRGQGAGHRHPSRARRTTYSRPRSHSRTRSPPRPLPPRSG